VRRWSSARRCGAAGVSLAPRRVEARDPPRQRGREELVARGGRAWAWRGDGGAACPGRQDALRCNTCGRASCIAGA
jgi:hypothetical protein